MPDPTDFTTFALLGVHAGATLVMVGVIWTMQLVHYPLFARIPADVFVAYERSHMNRISLIVGPTMLAELATALWIAIAPPPGVPPTLAGIGLGLVLVNALSTATLQGPAHQRLAGGWDEALIARLVRTNWIRTACWSARGVIALWMLSAIGSAGA